jgi:hypothetical protein
MTIGRMKMRPLEPPKSWKTATAAPSVAAKPSPTAAIKYQGATRLCRRSPRMRRISTAATGNTIA